MYITALVPAEIELGRTVTEQLLEANVPVLGSLWIYVGEASEWRLMLATNLVDQLGPSRAYEYFQTRLRKLDIDFSLRKLWLVSPREPIYRALRTVFRDAKSVMGMRLTSTQVEGVLIEDAYVYRIQ